ncbi:MAG: KH domain-containing protein, partial [Clostridia bacterium]|nr:KH domain-containing protein [Clostridia bacterium]
MKELLISIAAGLVQDPSAVTVTEDAPDAEGVIVFHLHVAPDDMGRVIGKQGRIAKAIRT